VFAHPIDWAMFDAARATLVPRLSQWVDKKIQDMLGEREESMVSVSRAAQLCQPSPDILVRLAALGTAKV